jgi:GTPase
MSLVAIVGRPNVGKSTLFNRLTRSKAAIVDDQPGVTRDRVYGVVHWNGREFSVIDTGGFVPNSADRFEEAIREQVKIAIEESDALMFVLDTTTGMTDLDDSMVEVLRRSKKPVYVVANKADNEQRRWETHEFYQAGLGEVFPVSAINGTGTGELLDAVVEGLPSEEPRATAEDVLRIAVIGRPNVGKSSVVNTLLGEERSIVTEISGTTRDAIHTPLKYHGRDMLLIDTAGLRKRAKVSENIEFYSTLRTERALEECDIAILLLDAEEGLNMQDIRVLKQAEALRKGIIIGVNKWDLIDKETNTARDYERSIYERLQTMDYVPVVFISALTRQRVPKLIDLAIEVDAERKKHIATSKLNDFLEAAVARSRPPTYRNRYVRIKYVTQIRDNPPLFAFFCNQPKGIRESYRRYLENRLRETFGFRGVPLNLVFKQK